MNVLVVDHNAVRASDRALYRAFEEEGIAHTSVVVPAAWEEFGQVFLAEKDPGKLRVIPLPVLFGGKHHRVMYRGLSQLLRSKEPDILFLNAEPENQLALQAVLAVRTLRRPPAVVLTSWRNIDPRIVGSPYRLGWVHQWIERMTLKESAWIVAHSAAARDLYYSYGFERVSHIPPAVDPAPYLAALPILPKAKGFRIGYIGRFTSLKGGEVLLSAAASLPDDCQVVMAGAGEMRDVWMRKALSLGIQGRLLWPGALHHEEVPSMLKSLDVLVLPSLTGTAWKEQFGRVLIEAMAAGTVTVGSDSGEIPGVLGDAGLVVREGDPAALADALLRLYRGPELLSRLAALGKERVAHMYSIEAVLPLYRTLFERLMGRSDEHRL